MIQLMTTSDRVVILMLLFTAVLQIYLAIWLAFSPEILPGLRLPLDTAKKLDYIGYAKVHEWVYRKL